MPFNLFRWLFEDAVTAGSYGNLSGAEQFHYFWQYLIFCGVGLLIWFYYWVEGRKRFVDSNYPLKDMLDRFLNWLAVICFIGIPVDLARVVLDGSFFAWRFWRYLWLVALLVWAVLWVIYFVRKFPEEKLNFKALLNRRASEHQSQKSEKLKKERKAEKDRRKARKRAKALSRTR
jgi:hypothetical protein